MRRNGAALLATTKNSGSKRYGIELDAHRAVEARTTLDEVIQGNAFDAKAPVESFSLLYLNPPYDFEVGEGKNQRMEKLFLDEFFRWLKPGGVLALVIPYDRTYECRNILSPHFKDKAIYRLTEPEAERYKQAVVFGVRRSAVEKNRLSDQAVNQANWKLQELTRRYEEIPPLPDEADRAYAVPQSESVRMEYRGLPLDMVEDLVAKSPAVAASPAGDPRPTEAILRTAPNSSARWPCRIVRCERSAQWRVRQWSRASRCALEAIKVVDKTEEEGDDGETVIREKERFSQRLTLLFTDGRIELLSEKPREKGGEEAPNGERPPANGKLKFVRQTRDTITEVSLHLDRLVAEKPAEPRSAVQIHLVSVFGGDQEVGAIAAAIADEQRFQISLPGWAELFGFLGEKPVLYRASLQIPGRKRPVRHLAAVSQTLFGTTLGADGQARRTILYDGSPEFVLHRLAVRFGLPALPEWAEWFGSDLERRGLVEELLGFNCSHRGNQRHQAPHVAHLEFRHKAQTHRRASESLTKNCDRVFVFDKPNESQVTGGQGMPIQFVEIERVTLVLTRGQTPRSDSAPSAQQSCSASARCLSVTD